MVENILKMLKKAKSLIIHYIFDSHPLAKLICLIMSIILFSYIHFDWQVSSPSQNTIEYSMDIKLTNIPSALTIAHIDHKNAIISFSGDKNVLSSVMSDISIYIDVSDATEGVNKYNLSMKNASLLPVDVGFTLTPKYVNITFESLKNDN